MIPSHADGGLDAGAVYQRGVVIDSQHGDEESLDGASISKGSGD